MFAETIDDRPIDSLAVGAVVRKYVETLKLADYRGLGINFRAHVPHPSSESAAAFIKNRLLAPGGWLGYGNGRVNSKLSFDYDLTDRYLSLSISEAALETPDRSPLAVVLFSGNFSYDLSEVADGLKAEAIANVIGNWQRDLLEFTSLIEGEFLGDFGEHRREVEMVEAIVVSEANEPVDAPDLPPVLALN